MDDYYVVREPPVVGGVFGPFPFISPIFPGTWIGPWGRPPFGGPPFGRPPFPWQGPGPFPGPGPGPRPGQRE